MIIITLIILIITLTLTLILSNTPIILGINILLMALILSATVAATIRSWFAFLVFLIYIGGILVIFAYFLALSPNQQMPRSTNIIYIIITTVIITYTVIRSKITLPAQTIIRQNNIFLYMPSTAPMLIFLAILLLLTIIIVVKLTRRSKGPLRPFFYV